MSSVLTTFPSRGRLRDLQTRPQSTHPSTPLEEPSNIGTDEITPTPHTARELIELQREIQELQELLRSPHLGGKQSRSNTGASGRSRWGSVASMSTCREESSLPPTLPPIRTVFQQPTNGFVVGGEALERPQWPQWISGETDGLTGRTLDISTPSTSTSGALPGLGHSNAPPPLALPPETIGLEPVTPEGPISSNGQPNYEIRSFRAHVCVPLNAPPPFSR